MPRELPAIAEFAMQAAGRLGADAAVALYEGEYPSSALAFDGHHLVLIRDHGWTFSLSLPTGPGFDAATNADWDAAAPNLTNAVKKLRKGAPQMVSMSDVVVALLGFDGLAADHTLEWPGTSVPQEAWFTAKPGTIGLFQEGATVRVVVWVGSDFRFQLVDDPAALKALEPWLATELPAQRAAAAAAEAEAARIAALPLPPLDAVWAALRRGLRLQIGGGRYHRTYFLRGADLWCEEFDEGQSTDWRVDEPDTTLREAIANEPDQVRHQLGDGQEST